jgi:putative SOS response-associated peptidase YedK
MESKENSVQSWRYLITLSALAFTIITTRANGLVRRIHDRMPVIYDAAMGRQWLDGPFGNRAMELDLLLQPLPSERIEAHEVSTLSIHRRVIRRSASNLFHPIKSLSRSCGFSRALW